MTMTIQKAAVKRGQMEVTIDDDDFVVTPEKTLATGVKGGIG